MNALMGMHNHSGPNLTNPPAETWESEGGRQVSHQYHLYDDKHHQHDEVASTSSRGYDNQGYDEIAISSAAGAPPVPSHDDVDMSEEEKRISLEILNEINIDPKEDKARYVKWPCSNRSTSEFINKVFRNPLLASA